MHAQDKELQPQLARRWTLLDCCSLFRPVSMGLEVPDTLQAAFVEQLRARHATSKQPESQAIVAVLSAIVDVIASQKLQPTPVSVFAAVVSSLSTGAGRSDPQALMHEPPGFRKPKRLPWDRSGMHSTLLLMFELP